MKEEIQKLRQKYVNAERQHYITFKEKSRALRAKVSVLTELLNIINDAKRKEIDKYIASEQLLSIGIKFTRTKLGQATFIPVHSTGTFSDKMLYPADWSISQLRAMADYMEANPDCALFDDGSGKPCRK